MDISLAEQRSFTVETSARNAVRLQGHWKDWEFWRAALAAGRQNCEARMTKDELTLPGSRQQRDSSHRSGSRGTSTIAR